MTYHIDPTPTITLECEYCAADLPFYGHDGEPTDGMYTLGADEHTVCHTCQAHYGDGDALGVRSMPQPPSTVYADNADLHPRCLGVGRRFCENLPTEDTPYCVECHTALDALHDRARGATPPAPATPSPITITLTESGMRHIKYRATTIGVCSEDALEALRLYLAAPTIEAYDDALEMIEALRAA